MHSQEHDSGDGVVGLVGTSSHGWFAVFEIGADDLQNLANFVPLNEPITHLISC